MAKKSNKRNKSKHGAVIVKGSSVIGMGYNRTRTNGEWQMWNDVRCSFHAEEFAIRKAAGSLKGATIYVARITSSGESAISKPCEKCQKMIEESGIRKVVYTT